MTQNQTTYHYISNESKKPKGVCLLCHGLNLNPSKMIEIINYLNSLEIDCINISLFEKAPTIEQCAEITPKKWAEVFYHYYLIAHKRSVTFNVPLYFVGFSLGGLLGQCLLSQCLDLNMPSLSNDNQYFNKQVLFAPALELSYKQYLLMLLQFLPNSFLVPSVHMPEYRFHEGTTLGAYRACIEASKNFKKLSSKKALNIPTLVFLNPNDELINYKNTVSLLKSHDLRSWSIELVSNSQSSHSKPRAHMMIDSTCLGDAEWKKVQNKIKNHFLL